MNNDLLKRINAKKQARHNGQKKGVYAEVSSELFDRLQDRRRINKKRGLEISSNYKLIEAAITMLLDYMDDQDRPPSKKAV